jgi:hypothetical protein
VRPLLRAARGISATALDNVESMAGHSIDKLRGLSIFDSTQRRIASSKRYRGICHVFAFPRRSGLRYRPFGGTVRQCRSRLLPHVEFHGHVLGSAEAGRQLSQQV